MLRMTKGDVLQRTQVLLKKVGIFDPDLLILLPRHIRNYWFTSVRNGEAGSPAELKMLQTGTLAHPTSVFCFYRNGLILKTNRHLFIFSAYLMSPCILSHLAQASVHDDSVSLVCLAKPKPCQPLSYKCNSAGILYL